MNEKMNYSGVPTTRKKYMPAFKAQCVRKVAAGAWQNGRGPRPGHLAGPVGPGSVSAGASRAQKRGTRRNQAATRRAQARGNGARYLKKVVTIFCQLPQS